MALTKVSYSMIGGAPVNVLDFGASPSASAATNTTAINAALASSTNVNLYFPPGIYNHTGIRALNLDNLTITGDGATLFLANGSNVRALETTNCDYVHISGITLDGNQTNQIITGARLNGAGIVINSALTVIIQNNTIKNVSTGASIALNSANPFAADTTTESVLIDNNTIRDSGFTGAPFTCDGIYCQYDNVRITNNKIFNSTDFGVALEYSKRSVVSNNSVYDAEVGLGGVGVDSCVFSDNTLTDCLFRGIFFSTGGQAVTSPWISYRTVIANNVINGVGGSLLPGNTHGIQVDYGNVHTDFVINGNYIQGGDYGLTISTNGCIASNNQIKNSVVRGVLTDSNSYVNLFNNVVDTVTLPNYEIVKIGQVADTDKTNNQKRFFTGTSSGAGVIYRACYIKTDNTTNNRSCVVNLTVTSNVPGIGPSASFRQMSIKCVAGTLTITDMLPYSGDTTNIVITMGQNGTSRAEVLAGNSTTATTCSVIVDIISMDATQPFYIVEA
jgi:parallel beta-helix repeat protein